jgi:prepilin-type N-terminal cleavage/methylation domain-containing protein
MRKSNAGFTLMEVLVAVAILGGGIFILLQTHYAVTQAHLEMREEVMVRGLMEQAMGMARIELAAGNGSGSGEFGKRHPNYEYRFDAVALSEEENPGLYEVSVILEGPEEAREMFIMMFAPAFE